MLIHMNGVAGWFGAGGFHLWSPMMAVDEVGMWRVKVPSSLLLLAMELEIGDSVGGIFNQNWLLFSGIEHRIEIRLYVGGGGRSFIRPILCSCPGPLCVGVR